MAKPGGKVFHCPNGDGLDEAMASIAATDGTAALKASTGSTPKAGPSARSTAIDLLRRGFKPTVVHPGEKRPIGNAWGLEELTEAVILGKFNYKPDAGVGLRLGDGNAPGGGWLIDVEGDGEEAEDSLTTLFDGEDPPTMGWSSRRGRHRLFVADDRFLAGLIAARAKEGTGQGGVGKYELDELPGLEIRVGGFFDDGIPKQVHSACPPTIGDDGKPREWNGCWDVATLPNAAIDKLAEIAAAKAAKPAERTGGFSFEKTVPSSGDGWAQKAFDDEIAKLAGMGKGDRNNQLFRTVANLTEIVNGGRLDGADVYGAVLGACRINGLGDGPAVEASIRSAIRRVAGKSRGPKENGRPNGQTPLDRSPGPRPWTPPTEEEVDAVEIVDRWPKYDPHIFYGVAGRIVQMIDPYTESDPVATLVQFLAGFGNLIDRQAYFVVTATLHYLKIYPVLVGETGEGRKGTSWDAVRWVLSLIDQFWADNCIHDGLVSGEGLIHYVRDERYEEKETKDKKTGVVTRETVLVDAGVKDKRLLVVESEFSRTLKAASRDSNTLTPVIRQAWETDKMKTMAKHNSSKATGAHVTIIAHVTRDDLKRYMLDVDQANGFSNRFLWTAVRRSKDLPNPGNITKVDWSPIVDELKAARDFVAGGPPLELNLSPDAQVVWDRLYATLRARVNAKHLNRSHGYVKRIAAIYAVLDRTTVIGVEHLTAAYALWAYCEESTGYIFGDDRNPREIKLLEALEKTPQGLKRSEIASKVFGNNLKADQLKALLETLLTRGEIHRKRPQTGGKGCPPETWFIGREGKP